MDKKELVAKSNRLVEASYRLTLVEQQIVLFAISRSREEQRGLSAEDPITITAASFARQFGSEPGSVYGQLKEALDTLYLRSVTLYDKDPESGKDRVTKHRWISQASYIDGAGTISFVFAIGIIPYITRLETEFTRYRLDEISGMTSAYAVRLYELLVQYATTGSRLVALDWLRDVLQLENEYPEISDLKRRVIDVAVLQINARSDLEVSYTQRKRGRQITHLLFNIVRRAEEKPKKIVVDEAYVKEHADRGESWEEANCL